ncbi:unnamed protein product [Alternaria alternata]
MFEEFSISSPQRNDMVGWKQNAQSSALYIERSYLHEQLRDAGWPSSWSGMEDWNTSIAVHRLAMSSGNNAGIPLMPSSRNASMKGQIPAGLTGPILTK